MIGHVLCALAACAAMTGSALADWAATIDSLGRPAIGSTVTVTCAPGGQGGTQPVDTCLSQHQAPVAAVGLVKAGFGKSLSFQNFQRRCQRCSVHAQQGYQVADAGRFRLVQRHQQRELPIGQTMRAQHLVKAAGQHAGGALDVKAQAMIPHLVRGFERQCLAHPGHLR